MSDLYYIVGASVIVVLAVIVFVLRRRPGKLNRTQLDERWSRLQKQCVDKKTWHKAVVDADKLLDDTLKKLHYKGKTGGERLVAAQRKLTKNESVWFGHKLRNKIVQEGVKAISKQDTLEALSGFRQALKDLGALVDKKPGLDDD